MASIYNKTTIYQRYFTDLGFIKFSILRIGLRNKLTKGYFPTPNTKPKRYKNYIIQIKHFPF